VEAVTENPLPPPPDAVRSYFALRVHSLSGWTPEEVTANERLWHVEICGLPEATFRSPEPAPSVTTQNRIPPIEKSENGGSKPAGVVREPPTNVTPLYRACEECRRPFRPTRPWSTFCSPRCKQRAKRARRSAA
jgi:hypothetical protein